MQEKSPNANQMDPPSNILSKWQWNSGPTWNYGIYGTTVFRNGNIVMQHKQKHSNKKIVLQQFTKKHITCYYRELNL